MRLILNLNTQCQSVMTITGGNWASFVTTSLNNVFPCMMSPIGQKFGFTQNNATSATLSLGIAKSYSSGTYTHPVQSSCRFYARMCEMTPQYEEMYLSAVPTKRILFNDILSFQAFGVAGVNGTVSQILTNGISRPRYLLICPQMSNQINGSATNSLASTYVGGVQCGYPMNSPFSSSPATSGCQAAISNLNILVSGTNIYQSNYIFGYEEFLQEVRGSNALNGGIPLGLSSGLLSQNDWENGYRFVYVDLSRRLSQANDDISRSIQIIFTNVATYQCDYFVFVGFEKQIDLSTSTGALVI